MKKVLFFCISVVSLSFFSCKDKETPMTCETVEPAAKVKLNFQPKFKGENLVLNDVYTFDNGYRAKFSKISLITTNLKNGNETLIASDIFNYEDDGTTMFTTEGDYSKFSNLSFGIGVDAERNHDDPSALDNNDPLNILNASDMHWNWNPGYIFFKIEGKADTTTNQTGEFNQFFLYHVGKDANFRTKEITGLNWTSAGDKVHEATLALNVESIFYGEDTVDIRLTNSSHSTDAQLALTKKLADNFKAAIVAN